MTLRTQKLLYLAFWALVVVAAIYVAQALGRPWWDGFLAGYGLFWLGNGTFAYLYRARKMRSEGRQPEGYARYMLLGRRGSGDDPVPRSLRVVVGLVTMAVGAISLLIGGTFSWLLLTGGAIQPHTAVNAAFLLLLCAAPLCLGAVFAYVGFRFVFGKDDETFMSTKDASLRE